MTSTLCSKTFTAFVFLILLTGIADSAETLDGIYLHTDNLNDFKQLTRRRAGGIGSATNLLAINELDLNIKMEFMPLKRSLQLMDQQHPVCAINKVSNIQRIQKYLFSYPVNIFMNRMLYQIEGSTPLIQEAVSLAALFKKRSKCQLLLTAQISYGAEVDAQLQQIPAKNKLYRNSVAYSTNNIVPQGEGLLSMFRKKRAEFALFYPQQLFEADVEFLYRSYPIKGTSPYIIGHIMCAKIDGMKAVINKFNQNLKSAYSSGKLLATHLQFLDPRDAEHLAYYYREIAELYKTP